MPLTGDCERREKYTNVPHPMEIWTPAHAEERTKAISRTIGQTKMGRFSYPDQNSSFGCSWSRYGLYILDLAKESKENIFLPLYLAIASLRTWQ